MPAPDPMPRPPVDYDAELRLHHQVLRRACGVGRHDHVLDVGCGTGQTTRQAARTATAGSALGVDLSAAMLDRARDLARAQGLGNVTFQRADAQVHRFPPARFDLAISRFGTMFFDDPAAAFANIARALRPGGRLVMMVWQGQEHNEWAVAIHRSLEPFEGSVAVAPAGPDPFSLADPARVAGILEVAGWSRSASATCTNPSTTVQTSPPRWPGSVASPAPTTCCSGWILLAPSARSSGCATRWPRTRATTASGWTRAPGSSPPADPDRAAAGSVSPTRPAPSHAPSR
jgi:SAM-dependent methyltransferase